MGKRWTGSGWLDDEPRRFSDEHPEWQEPARVNLTPPPPGGWLPGEAPREEHREDSPLCEAFGLCRRRAVAAVAGVHVCEPCFLRALARVIEEALT